MQLLRGLAGVLLLIVAAVLGLVAVLLCVTLILLPIGLPLLEYARRLFMLALKLVLPRAISHPVQSADKSLHKGGRRTKQQLAASTPDFKSLRKRGHDTVRRVRKRVPIHS